MRRPLDLSFPRKHGWSRIAFVAAVIVHVLLFLGPIESHPPRLPPERPVILVPLPPPATAAPDLVYLMPRGSRDVAPSRGRGAVERPPDRASPPPAITPTPSIRGRPLAPSDSGTPTAQRQRIGKIGPDYGEGVGWVRPIPFSPAELARHLERSHVEKVDSAVTAIMQAFLDSLQAEPGAATRLPDWTTTLAGSKFGLDSRYIYVAGLKIPAAVLALLPLPSGNVSQDRALDHLIDMRADIEQAARRAQNMEDFKRAIREIRDRKQRERDFERAQREPPPPPEQPPPERQP